MEPREYPRRILLAVTGNSPQVITETLWALTQPTDGPNFVPTEIHIITTSIGARNANLNLLVGEKGSIGWFNKFVKEYPLPEILFSSATIHVVPDEQGRLLDDIRTLADNRQAADFILEKVRELTSDPQSALFVSIAGGRKTMGFYLGYALSLCGRPQDRLSHVLVQDAYENNKDFYYPTRESCVIYSKDGKQAYDSKDAQVDLADIPFVRLRDAILSELLTGTARYSRFVEEAQQGLPPLSLEIYPRECRIVAGGRSLRLQKAQFMLYWMVAERKLQGLPGVHWRDNALAQEILDFFGRYHPTAGGHYENLEKLLLGNNNAEEQLDSLRKWLTEMKSKTNRKIREALGERLAKAYMITNAKPRDREGHLIHNSPFDLYVLDIPADKIEVVA